MTKRKKITKRENLTPMEPEGRNNILSCAWLSLFLLLYVFLPAFILSVFLLLRVDSPALAYWSSLAVLSGLLWIMRSKIGTVGRLAVGCLCFLVIVIAAHAVSWSFFDVFQDGLAYHQPATARIAAGFNPVYDGYMDLGRSPDTWSDQATYFPKATWYFAAAVHAALGDIQLGKAYHLILFFSALFFVLHHTREERFMKRLLWASSCLNPLVFHQCTGHVLDSALGSLSIIALFYANLHFSGKPVPRNAHVMGVISLAMLSCVKTSGVAYGGVIVFCICLQRLFAEYRSSKKSWSAALAAATKLGLRIGIPLFLLVAALGFSPYLTNLLDGRHIFYPLMGAPADSGVPETAAEYLETLARFTHPEAHNRVTRLLRSLVSYSYPSPFMATLQVPAVLKNPFLPPRLEWMMYNAGAEFATGGMGPLFFLLLMSSLPFCFFLRDEKNAWLIFTLFAMLFIQPHAWYIRFAPFLWALPFVFCLSAPRKLEYFLAVPILLAVVNSCGAAYVSLNSAGNFTRVIADTLSPHRGEYVLLNKTTSRLDGIFDRFDITQRFGNSEDTSVQRRPLFYWNDDTLGRRPILGHKITFEASIPPLPALPVVFTEESSRPWTKMSEGIGILEYKPNTPLNPHPYPVFKGLGNDAGKLKFYMRVTEKPAGDMELTLAAGLREAEEEGEIIEPQRMFVYVNDRRIGEWLWDRTGSEGKTVTIPLEALEEAHDSPMNLLILRFDLSGAETNAVREFSLMLEKMEFHASVSL